MRRSLPLLLVALPILAIAQKGWTPNQAATKSLAPSIPVDGYKLSPPLGYMLRTSNAPSGAVTRAWVGKPRPDGTSSMMMFCVFNPQGKGTLKEGLQELLDGIKRRRTDWQQGKFEEGKIGGVKFLRARWTGIANGMKIQGVHYLGQDGKKFIMLWTQDVLPAGQPALKVTEASILSFKKG